MKQMLLRNVLYTMINRQVKGENSSIGRAQKV